MQKVTGRAASAPVFGNITGAQFCLAWVKYMDKQHAGHLMNALKEDYTISHDWTGKQYIGLTIDWDYEKQEVHISIPGYI